MPTDKERSILVGSIMGDQPKLETTERWQAVGETGASCYNFPSKSISHKNICKLEIFLDVIL